MEVDERQNLKKVAAPQAGLHFVAGVAQTIPFADASFDLALMLKSRTMCRWRRWDGRWAKWPAYCARAACCTSRSRRMTARGLIRPQRV